MLHLPKSTAIPAIHLLIGIPPVEALHDIRTLNLFRNIIATDIVNPPALFMKELITRQLAMKGNESTSWTSHIQHLLKRYSLPLPSWLLSNPPTKREWKKTVNKAVFSMFEELQKQASSKSSLGLLKVDVCFTNEPHPIWRNLSNPMAIKKATIKAMLLVQRYPLTTC